MEWPSTLLLHTADAADARRRDITGADASCTAAAMIS